MMCGVSKVLAAKLQVLQNKTQSSNAESAALSEAKTKHETVQVTFQSYTEEEEKYSNDVAQVVTYTYHFEHHLVEINLLLC